jgi:hypothetical protein
MEQMSYIEGFSDPTMSSIFNTMLTITVKKPHSAHDSLSKSKSKSKSGSCAPSVPSQAPLTLPTGSNPDESTSFLKTVLEQQKQSVDSLMTTAKRVNPLAKKASQMEAAYDTAFENETAAAQPKLGATLQGFVLLFFLVSYVALTIVTCMTVNMLTESGTKTAGTFVMFLVLGFVLLSLIIQLG